ncbi:P-loop containing nucleoside triphosphate hydrolase protein [Parasitella parasitica]|nr:P-loop containing nucleoside triphosphate hydrolase protein [Parasitella parasitica]
MSQSSKYLSIDSLTTSRIPVKSASTTLPRKALASSTSTNTNTSCRQKAAITTPLTVKSSKSNIRQRATTTPRVHRRSISASSSNASTGNNWLTSIFSSTSTSVAKKKKRMKSVIKLSVEKDSCDWQLEEDNVLRYLGPKSRKKFEFDHIFRKSSTNKHLFDTSVKSTIQDVMLGLNGTVFTYGQPGTGKSYGNNKDLGIVPLTFETVFQTIKNDDNHEYMLSLACFEIANEVLRDLFSEHGEALKISDENKRRGAHVMSLQEQIITSPREALQLIKRAEANRYMLTNNYDIHHSRAHTFIQLTVEKREKQAASKKPNLASNISLVSSISSSTSSSRRTKVPQKKTHDSVHVSYLYLIDMASNDKSIFQTLKSPINKSCLAFEAVVYNLSEAGKSARHPLPPYHDSKLTRLLQPTFMGHHQVVSVCTIDMESAVQDEIPTLDILSFASRIKRIPVDPKICEISDDRSLLIKYLNKVSLIALKLEKLDRDQTESSTDLSSIKSALEQKLYSTSRLILSSQSVISHPALEDENDDPWRVISRLRQEFDTLTADKDNQLKQLKSAMEETKGLPDEIAHLEAELNITRAELQVTQLLVNEASSPATNSLRYAK